MAKKVIKENPRSDLVVFKDEDFQEDEDD